MYIPPHFKEQDIDALYDCIRRNPFATLVTSQHGDLNADHLPVYLNTHNPERHCVQGHIATANPLWKNIKSADKVLLIFQGNNAYITPNWLPSKKVDGKVVPTWNYSAVHVKGNIQFIHAVDWKLKLLDDLTAQQENNQDSPWLISDAPADFIQKLLPAIVGFEISITEIFGKLKLSQNQSQTNRAGIAEGLKKQGHDMAAEIQTL